MDSGTRSVAIIGSSGGNLRSQGGDDPAGLLSEIIRQLSTAGLTVAAVQFVAAASSMESAAGSTPAALWVLGQLSVLGPALRAAAVPPAVATRTA